MGNAESNPVRNMDKRTSRREYKDYFIKGIDKFKKTYSPQLPSSESSITPIKGDGELIICIRKRPIFDHEIGDGEFDVVTCQNNNEIIIHDARMNMDMRSMYLNHNIFQFDRIFNENTRNEEVFQVAALPLLQTAAQGGYSTCLVYGQTGSGKTYTMTYVYERTAQELFSLVESGAGNGLGPASISVSFFEVAGEVCSDLLNAYSPLQLMTAKDESVHPFPVVEVVVSNAAELLAIVMHGCNVRSKAATGVHDASSRSHAILRIYVNRDFEGREEVSSQNSISEGVLTLVDLAGSEFNIDSAYHSGERRKEGAAINASLSALKDCLRARAVGKINSFIYRNSKLTMALKLSFTLKEAKTLIISCCSPASKDTEHTLSTLRHACIMDGQTDGGETRFLTGGLVQKQELGDVNISQIARDRKGNKERGAEDLKNKNGNFFAGHAAPELTDKQKEKVRRQAETRAIKKLLPQHRDLLLDARDRLRCEPRQVRRIQRSLEREAPSNASPSLNPSPTPSFPQYGGCSVQAGADSSTYTRSSSTSALDARANPPAAAASAAAIPSSSSRPSAALKKAALAKAQSLADARALSPPASPPEQFSHSPQQKRSSSKPHTPQYRPTSPDEGADDPPPVAPSPKQPSGDKARVQGEKKWVLLAELMRTTGFPEDQIEEAVRYAKLAELMRQNGYSEADILVCRAVSRTGLPLHGPSPPGTPGKLPAAAAATPKVQVSPVRKDAKLKSKPRHSSQDAEDDGSGDRDRDGGKGRDSPAERRRPKGQDRRPIADDNDEESFPPRTADDGEEEAVSVSMSVGRSAKPKVVRSESASRGRPQSASRDAARAKPKILDDIAVPHQAQAISGRPSQMFKAAAAAAAVASPQVKKKPQKPKWVNVVNDESETVDEIKQIEDELDTDELTDAARNGLKKRLAKLNAVQVREQRQREMREREARQAAQQKAGRDSRAEAEAEATNEEASFESVGSRHRGGVQQSEAAYISRQRGYRGGSDEYHEPREQASDQGLGYEPAQGQGQAQGQGRRRLRRESWEDRDASDEYDDGRQQQQQQRGEQPSRQPSRLTQSPGGGGVVGYGRGGGSGAASNHDDRRSDSEYGNGYGGARNGGYNGVADVGDGGSSPVRRRAERRAASEMGHGQGHGQGQSYEAGYDHRGGYPAYRSKGVGGGGGVDEAAAGHGYEGRGGYREESRGQAQGYGYGREDRTNVRAHAQGYEDGDGDQGSRHSQGYSAGYGNGRGGGGGGGGGGAYGNVYNGADVAGVEAGYRAPRRRGGAASAPFANDLTWDKPV